MNWLKTSRKLLSVFLIAVLFFVELNVISTESAYAGRVLNCWGVNNNCSQVNVDVGLPEATGFVGGVGLDLAAIYGLGVTGFSGAGITSGLAALGSVAGGGMLAGVVVTAAIPIVTVVSVGTGIHLISNFFSHPENR